jgi:hypothetical protein
VSPVLGRRLAGPSIFSVRSGRAVRWQLRLFRRFTVRRARFGGRRRFWASSHRVQLACAVASSRVVARLGLRLTAYLVICIEARPGGLSVLDLRAAVA